MSPAPTVLIVDDEPTVADSLRLTLEREGYAVQVAGDVRSALLAAAHLRPQAAIVDLVLPDGEGLTLTRDLKRRDPALEVIIVTAYGSVRKAMEATKGAGAFHVLEKPFDPDEILALLRSALDHCRLVAENTALRRRLGDRLAETEILGRAPAMERTLEMLATVADTDASVLILGETGTGKELVANALHERSRRRHGPWIKINCAALPKELIESELFGHVRGAFTGATTEKTGLLRQAHHGSLLLDEITEMPVELQAKLLRVLEESTVRRIGATEAEPVDFRLISATNRDPESAVREGSLRSDLYFRINTLTIRIPPLRQRHEDIPILIGAFLDRYQAKHVRRLDGIDPAAYRRLLEYPWPGNIRELQHAVEHAVLVARGKTITVADLPGALQSIGEARLPSAPVAAAGDPADSLVEIERGAILKALNATNWNKRAAAAILGVRRPSLYSKMRRLGIPYQPQRLQTPDQIPFPRTPPAP